MNDSESRHYRYGAIARRIILLKELIGLTILTTLTLKQKMFFYVMTRNPGCMLPKVTRCLFKANSYTLLIGMLGIFPVSLQAIEIYVAPNGNDVWSGKLEQPNTNRSDGPKATLVGARDAIRKLKNTRTLSEPIRVIVADGRYPILAPLELNPEDGGSEKAPISYEAKSGAKPIFSGGRVIQGWRETANGVWTTQIPKVSEGKWYFEQLFVNGQRAVRARTPNKFWYYLLNTKEKNFDSNSKVRAKQIEQSVYLKTEDFNSVAKLKPEELKDVNLMVYHKWDNTRRFIDSVNMKEESIMTKGVGQKPWNPWKKNTPFILENALQFLDAPGEWFLDRSGVLYYKPRPDEKITQTEIIAPVAEKFLVINGEPDNSRWVEYLTFKGLSFQHGQWLTPAGGFEPIQAAASIEAAIMVDGARRIVFENCEVGHIGIYGLWFRKGCRDNIVRKCYFHDFGAGALRVGETKRVSSKDPIKDFEQTSHITLDNNLIIHGGYIFPCATGILVGQSGENIITHNEIADLFYTGISTGWTWGYGEGLAKRNRIEFNHVHHIGWGLLSDMGGIYTLGPSEGTVVRNNIFHDIYSYSYGGWGMYTDEGSTGILFENNLVYNTKTGSIHQHYGKENIFRNNILVNSKEHQIQVTRSENHLSFSFENNIIYWNNSSPALKGNWEKGRQVTRNNCYWNASGQTVTFVGKSLPQWQQTPIPALEESSTNPDWVGKRREEGSIIADPLFANPEKLDFSLKDNSPVLQLGFKPFDLSQVGLYGDPTWRAKAANVRYPQLQIAPEP